MGSIYVVTYMYYDCSRRLSCACRVWYTVVERLRELVAFTPKERRMSKIEDNETGLLVDGNADQLQVIR